MHIALMLLALLLIIMVLMFLYGSTNKDGELYDEKWIGSLELTEHFNQFEHNEFFYQEEDYQTGEIKMVLIIGYMRPPSEEEKLWSGRIRKFEKAKVIELEGRYFWYDLSSS